MRLLGSRRSIGLAIVTTHRGDVVGERTSASPPNKKLITLDDGSALILTVANYYNPEATIPMKCAATEEWSDGFDDFRATTIQPPRRTHRAVAPLTPGSRVDGKGPGSATSLSRKIPSTQSAGTSEVLAKKAACCPCGVISQSSALDP
jgi:hypothetical protein